MANFRMIVALPDEPPQTILFENRRLLDAMCIGLRMMHGYDYRLRVSEMTTHGYYQDIEVKTKKAKEAYDE